MSIYLNDERARQALDIRWMHQSGVFFVDFGNIRFSVSPGAAQVLADGLRDALAKVPEDQR